CAAVEWVDVGNEMLPRPAMVCIGVASRAWAPVSRPGHRIPQTKATRARTTRRRRRDRFMIDILLLDEVTCGGRTRRRRGRDHEVAPILRERGRGVSVWARAVCAWPATDGNPPRAVSWRGVAACGYPTR